LFEESCQLINAAQISRRVTCKLTLPTAPLAKKKNSKRLLTKRLHTQTFIFRYKIRATTRVAAPYTLIQIPQIMQLAINEICTLNTVNVLLQYCVFNL